MEITWRKPKNKTKKGKRDQNVTGIPQQILVHCELLPTAAAFHVAHAGTGVSTTVRVLVLVHVLFITFCAYVQLASSSLGLGLGLGLGRAAAELHYILTWLALVLYLLLTAFLDMAARSSVSSHNILTLAFRSGKNAT